MHILTGYSVAGNYLFIFCFYMRSFWSATFETMEIGNVKSTLVVVGQNEFDNRLKQ